MNPSASSVTSDRNRYRDLDAASGASAGAAHAPAHKAAPKAPAAAPSSSREALERMLGSSTPPDYSRLPRRAPSPGSDGNAKAAGAGATTPARLENPSEQAVRSAEAMRKRVVPLAVGAAHVARVVRDVHVVAEKAVAAGGAVSTLSGLIGGAGHMLLTGDDKPITEAVERGGRTIGYGLGNLRESIDRANAAHRDCERLCLEYNDVNLQYQRAMQAGDYKAAAEAGRRMEELVPAIKRSAAQFGALAKDAADRSKAYQGDALDAAIATHLAAISAGSMIPSEAHSATHTVAHVMVESVLETEGNRLLLEGSHE